MFVKSIMCFSLSSLSSLSLPLSLSLSLSRSSLKTISYVCKNLLSLPVKYLA